MYIRRKVFSILTNEEGEERLYSVNETLFEGYEVEQREFAKKRSDLEDYSSNRGYGRGMYLGGGLIPTAVGISAGRKAAIKADQAGKEDYQIENAAKKAGTKAGAGVGAGLGVAASAAALGLALKKKGIPLKSAGKYLANAAKTKRGAVGLATLAAAPVIGSVTGAISGRAGASKNTRSTLTKRAKQEASIKKVTGIE